MGRKRSREASDDSSRSTTDESEDEMKRSKRKDKKRKKDKHKKKEKKSHSEHPPPRPNEWVETASEEKAAKRAAKEAKKIASVFGYTNGSNPFGDHNLHQQFIWKAKAQSDKKAGKSVAGSKLEESERRLGLIKEIEKVRKRREDREKEIEEMERLKAEEARLREAELYDDWEKKEEEFHLQQAKVRSKIRLVEGREKPVDLLAKNLLLFGDETEEQLSGVRYKGKTELDLSNLEAELREPYLLFKDLSLDELKDLQQDIREYQQLESTHEGPNKAFWDALAHVCKDELKKAGVLAGSGKDGGNGGVHMAVASELEAMFDDKSVAQLEKARSDIQKKIDCNDGTVDVDYWENVLLELEVYRAKAHLREAHQEMLLRQLERLEERKSELARQRIEKAAAAAEEEQALAMEEEERDGDAVAPAPPAEPTNAGYDDSDAAMAMVQLERGKGLSRGEETLGRANEVELGDKVYWWHDKHRPRKPRYFNRVKTGWDWNKYNQTHYDHDNPPPKTVQGYKFNIFYPDLIDRTKAPTFVLEPADSDDFCIIRFHAGPPYEDIAFKIINREWERSHKRGFKCLFERGILHLYFNFKRALYRR